MLEAALKPLKNLRFSEFGRYEPKSTLLKGGYVGDYRVRVSGLGSKLLKGGLYRGLYRGITIGGIKGDTRSLDYSSYGVKGLMRFIRLRAFVNRVYR